MKKIGLGCIVSLFLIGALQAAQTPRPLPKHVQQMDSATRLGWMYYRGIGTKPNYKKAYYWFEKGTLNGDEQALFFRASMLQRGRGVKKDEERAFAIFKDLSHKYANPHAAFKLSLAYQHGIGCEADKTQSKRWLDFAAENGVPPAQLKKGMSLLKTNPAQGATWIKKAAENKHFRWAQYELARLYANGTGVKKNPALAFETMLQTAQHGLPRAQWQVAQWYETGFGTEADPKQAFDWTLTAAQNNVLAAQEHLIEMYQAGTGTLPNEKEAKKWEKRAHKTAKKQAARSEEFY